MAELLPVIENHKTDESNLIVRILWFLRAKAATAFSAS